MDKETDTYTFICGYGKEDEVMSFGRGLTTSLVYVNWINMHNRCYNPHAENYPHYGGSGITVCDEWNYKNKYGLLNFICWSLCGRNRYNPNIFQTIHRIDNNVGYCPENCMWADNRIQSSNKSTNRYVNFFGRTVTMSELANNFGISVSTINKRIYRNWNMDEVIQIPDLKNRLYYISCYKDRSKGLIVYHDSLVRPLYYADYDPNDPENWYGNYYWHELLIKRGVIPCDDLPVECLFPKEAPRFKRRNKDFMYNSTYFGKFQDG